MARQTVNLFPDITSQLNNLGNVMRYREEQGQQKKVEDQKREMIRQQLLNQKQSADLYSQAAGQSPVQNPERTKFIQQGLSTGTISPESAMKQLSPSLDDMITDYLSSTVWKSGAEKEAAMKFIEEAQKAKVIGEVFKIKETQKAIEQRQLNVNKNKKNQEATDKSGTPEMPQIKNIKVPVSKPQFTKISEMIDQYNSINNRGVFEPKQLDESATSDYFRRITDRTTKEALAGEQLYAIKKEILGMLSKNIGVETFNMFSDERKQQLAYNVFSGIYSSNGDYPMDSDSKDMLFDFKYSELDVNPKVMGINDVDMTPQDKQAFSYVILLKPNDPKRKAVLEKLRQLYPYNTIQQQPTE